jgi:hypothetical protein
MVTKIYESSCADGLPKMSRVVLYIGFFYTTPPFVPTEMGSSKLPLKYYYPSFLIIWYLVSGA